MEYGCDGLRVWAARRKLGRRRVGDVRGLVAHSVRASGLGESRSREQERDQTQQSIDGSMHWMKHCSGGTD